MFLSSLVNDQHQLGSLKELSHTEVADTLLSLKHSRMKINQFGPSAASAPANPGVDQPYRTKELTSSTASVPVSIGPSDPYGPVRSVSLSYSCFCFYSFHHIISSFFYYQRIGLYRCIIINPYLYEIMHSYSSYHLFLNVLCFPSILTLPRYIQLHRLWQGISAEFNVIILGEIKPDNSIPYLVNNSLKLLKKNLGTIVIVLTVNLFSIMIAYKLICFQARLNIKRSNHNRINEETYELISVCHDPNSVATTVWTTIMSTMRKALYQVYNISQAFLRWTPAHILVTTGWEIPMVAVHSHLLVIFSLRVET